MHDDYQTRQDARRDERREYEADTRYEIWRSGGDPDRMDPDRVDDCRRDGQYPEEAAARELRRQQPTPQEPELEQQYGDEH